VRDGAHTHHHGPNGTGLGTAPLIGAGLAVVTQLASVIAAVLHLVLIGLAVIVGLALLVLAVCAVTVYRRRHRAAWLSAPDWLPPIPEDVELPGDREVVSLRQAITELHAQLTAARVALDAGHRPDAHQHLHFHGLDPGQVAAILAASRRQAGDGR
jgi:hypothetical protein